MADDKSLPSFGNDDEVEQLLKTLTRVEETDPVDNTDRAFIMDCIKRAEEGHQALFCTLEPSTGKFKYILMNATGDTAEKLAVQVLKQLLRQQK